jgi:hypothetical protein
MKMGWETQKYSEERWLLDLFRWLEIIYWAVQVQYGDDKQKCMSIRRWIPAGPR